MIINCDCSHDFQDKLYGAGLRVMNPTSKEGIYRCSVCLKEKGFGGSSDDKKKKKK